MLRSFRPKARRPGTALVKVSCVPFEGLAAQTHRGKRKVVTSLVNLLGDRCWAGNLLVWFPAAWMPLVAEAIHNKTNGVAAHQGTAVLTAPADYLSGMGFRLKRWHADRTGQTPILHGSTNVSWLSLDPARVVRLFPTLYEGLLSDIYNQKVATAWEGAAHKGASEPAAA